MHTGHKEVSTYAYSSEVVFVYVYVFMYMFTMWHSHMITILHNVLALEVLHPKPPSTWQFCRPLTWKMLGLVLQL